FFCVSGGHVDLLSFPTRRSSDLVFIKCIHCSLTLLISVRVSHVSPKVKFRNCIIDALLKLCVPYISKDYLVAKLNVSASDRSIGDRKSTRLNSSHVKISYAVFCL